MEPTPTPATAEQIAEGAAADAAELDRKASGADFRANLKTVAERGWLDREAPRLRAILERPTIGPLGLAPCAISGRPAVFLPRGRVAMMVAPGGTGKTQAILQLAVAVAGGGSWFNTFPVARDAVGPVALILGEEDEASMHRRLHRIVKHLRLGEDPEDPDGKARVAANLHAMSVQGVRCDLVDAEGNASDRFDALQAALEAIGAELEGGWSLVILDPASRFLGPDAETDNAAATRWIEAIERLTRVPGNPTVLFCHHTNKGALGGTTDQGAARGSSALTDGARWQANLDRVPKYAQREDGKKAIVGHHPDRALLRLVKPNDVAMMPEPLRLERGDAGLLTGATKPWPKDIEPKGTSAASPTAPDDDEEGWV